jgi:predicted metal-dependent hydrolase
LREPLLGYVALDRLRELFSYVVALVYNARTLAEAAAFQQVVEEAVHSDRLRREVQAMGKTAAQALRDEGRRAEAVRSRQETLLLLLEQFNEELPAEVRAMIEGCKNVEQLDKWLRRIVGAERIEDVGIGE